MGFLMGCDDKGVSTWDMMTRRFFCFFPCCKNKKNHVVCQYADGNNLVEKKKIDNEEVMSLTGYDGKGWSKIGTWTARLL